MIGTGYLHYEFDNFALLEDVTLHDSATADIRLQVCDGQLTLPRYRIEALSAFDDKLCGNIVSISWTETITAIGIVWGATDTHVYVR